MNDMPVSGDAPRLSVGWQGFKDATPELEGDAVRSPDGSFMHRIKTRSQDSETCP